MDDHPFRGSEAVAAGWVSWARLRGPGYLRLGHDVYAPARVEVDLRCRIRAALVQHREGVVAGLTAARLWGVDDGRPGEPVELVVGPSGSRERPGVILRRDRLAAEDVTRREEFAVTSPLRTVYDVTRTQPLVTAVVAADALARGQGVRPGHVLAYAADRPRARGQRALRLALELVDPDSWSPTQTRVRLALVGAGLPRPVSSHLLVDGGGLPLALLDLAWPRARAGVVCVGPTPEQTPSLAAARAAGWFVHAVTDDDAERGLGVVARDIGARMRRACR